MIAKSRTKATQFKNLPITCVKYFLILFDLSKAVGDFLSEMTLNYDGVHEEKNNDETASNPSKPVDVSHWKFRKEGRCRLSSAYSPIVS